MAKKKETNTLNSEFILLCDYAFIGEGGKLCIIGKFETVFVRDVPSAHPEMFIVAHFSGEPNSTHHVNLQITDPTGKEMISKDAPVFQMKLSGFGTGNFMHRLFNFPINHAGTYTISFSEKKKELGKTTVSIMKVPSQNTSLPN